MDDCLRRVDGLGRVRDVCGDSKGKSGEDGRSMVSCLLVDGELGARTDACGRRRIEPDSAGPNVPYSRLELCVDDCLVVAVGLIVSACALSVSEPWFDGVWEGVL